MSSQDLKIEGLDDLKQKLAEIPRALRRSVLRDALKAGAREVRDEARRLAPVLKTPKNGRKPGTVKKAISVRTSKLATRSGDVGVFVNVRPAKGAIYKKGALVKESQRGMLSENDPYYWRWLEFGRSSNSTKKIARKNAIKGKVGMGKIEPIRFLQKSAGKLPEALNIFEGRLSKWFNGINQGGKIT